MKILSFAIFLLSATSALAQNDLPSGLLLGRFTPDGTQVSFSVSATSANIADPTSPGAVLVYNTGNQTALLGFGDKTITAPDDLHQSVEPGCYAAFAVNAGNYLAAVTRQGSTTLLLFGGHGLPAHGCVKQ